MSCVPFKRRSPQDIIMDILESAQKPARKTRIMYNCNLSFSQIQKYLRILDEAGLIANDGGFWKMTGKGSNLIESCKTCRLLVKKVEEQKD